jgi:hypothetical protein
LNESFDDEEREFCEEYDEEFFHDPGLLGSVTAAGAVAAVVGANCVEGTKAA